MRQEGLLAAWGFDLLNRNSRVFVQPNCWRTPKREIQPFLLEPKDCLRVGGDDLCQLISRPRELKQILPIGYPAVSIHAPVKE